MGIAVVSRGDGIERQRGKWGTYPESERKRKDGDQGEVGDSPHRRSDLQVITRSEVSGLLCACVGGGRSGGERTYECVDGIHSGLPEEEHREESDTDDERRKGLRLLPACRQSKGVSSGNQRTDEEE